jgi:hypothetical protein
MAEKGKTGKMSRKSLVKAGFWQARKNRKSEM